MPPLPPTERSVESYLKEKRLANKTFSYYNKFYGEAVKPLMERIRAELEINPHSVISIPPFNICGKELNTAYIILNRATLFLADWPDDDTNIYSRLREQIMFKKNLEKNLIEITKRPSSVFGIRESDGLKVGDKEIAERNDQGGDSHWQDALDNFIETSNTGEVLEMTALKLSIDDVSHIKHLMAGTGSGFELVNCTRGTIVVKRL